MDSRDRSPEPLPWCAYPRAADSAEHGLQPLPHRIPPAGFAAARRYRSPDQRIVPLGRMAPGQVLATAREVARSFARREPMGRHLVPPARPPAGLGALHHTDPFGTSAFGPWTPANIIFWLIRLLVLTDPASPLGRIRVNDVTLAHSLAALDRAGRVVGGAFNEIMPDGSALPGFRARDRFLDAVVVHCRPLLEFLGGHESAALTALEAHYPDFRAALRTSRVGHHFMIARSEALPRDHVFELVAATAERFRRAGCAFLGVEATNQWIGAACEVLGGVRVHFQPFRARQWVTPHATPLDHEVTSRDGYISDKDSGSMFYLINLTDQDLTA